MKASELLVVGIPGPILDSATEKELKTLEPGGIILFARNIEDAAQVGALVGALKRALPQVLLYIDAEGGRVDRLRNAVAPAPAGEVLAHRKPRIAERAGRWIGQSLLALGFDVDFAPVVDLDRGEQNNALDQRYLGDGPHKVLTRARRFLAGLESAGIAGCLKHFPGLGAAQADTHLEGAPIELSRLELEADLEPYRHLAEDAGAVMLSHAAYPALDERERPASLSPRVATELLRGDLGYSGLAFSDDLEMGALRAWGDLAELAVTSMAAGCDVILLCSLLEEGRGLAEALDQQVKVSRLREARQRLRRWREHCRHLKLGVRRSYSLATVRSRLADLIS